MFLRALLVLFALGDLALVVAMAALFDGLLQWFAMLVVAALFGAALIPLVLLVFSLDAVIDLPNLLAAVSQRHTGTGTELVTHLKGRQGAALRRLAIREAIPVLRSAYDVRGAAAAAVALARLNPVFLILCGICLLIQVVALAFALPLFLLGIST